MVLQTGGQEEGDPVDARCREARPSPSQSRTQRDAVPTGGLGPDELPPRGHPGGIETTRALAGWSASVFSPETSRSVAGAAVRGLHFDGYGLWNEWASAGYPSPSSRASSTHPWGCARRAQAIGYGSPVAGLP